MNEYRSRKFVKSICTVALAVAALGIAAVPALHAKPRAKDSADTPANVVAHVAVSGGAVKRMLLVKKSDREYLVLGLDSASGVTVFDVSDPSKPRMIAASAFASRPAPSEVTLVADTLALFGDSATISSQNIREIRSLAGVTASIKVRGLIYAANPDGLWIVKTKQRADADEAIENNNYAG